MSRSRLTEEGLLPKSQPPTPGQPTPARKHHRSSLPEDNNEEPKSPKKQRTRGAPSCQFLQAVEWIRIPDGGSAPECDDTRRRGVLKFIDGWATKSLPITPSLDDLEFSCFQREMGFEANDAMVMRFPDSTESLIFNSISWRRSMESMVEMLHNAKPTSKWTVTLTKGDGVTLNPLDLRWNTDLGSGQDEPQHNTASDVSMLSGVDGDDELSYWEGLPQPPPLDDEGFWSGWDQACTFFCYSGGRCDPGVLLDCLQHPIPPASMVRLVNALLSDGEGNEIKLHPIEQVQLATLLSRCWLVQEDCLDDLHAIPDRSNPAVILPAKSTRGLCCICDPLSPTNKVSRRYTRGPHIILAEDGRTTQRYLETTKGVLKQDDDGNARSMRVLTYDKDGLRLQTEGMETDVESRLQDCLVGGFTLFDTDGMELDDDSVQSCQWLGLLASADLEASLGGKNVLLGNEDGCYQDQLILIVNWADFDEKSYRELFSQRIDIPIKGSKGRSKRKVLLEGGILAATVAVEFKTEDMTELLESWQYDGKSIYRRTILSTYM